MTIHDDGFMDGGEAYTDEEMEIIEQEEIDLERKKQAYIDNSGNNCIYCNSTNISGDNVEIDAMGASQIVHCNECGKRWIDIYSLTNVMEYPE